MTITVSGRKMPVTDALREYAEEKVGSAIKVLDVDPINTEIVLYNEKNPANPLPAICGSPSASRATSCAWRKAKRTCTPPSTWPPPRSPASCASTRPASSTRRCAPPRKSPTTSTPAAPEGELDLDRLMDELAGDEVVRVKEIEFAPMTEEEALIEIDLIGHDFFVYTDRDTNLVCVLYRREGGGYGKLKQKED